MVNAPGFFGAAGRASRPGASAAVIVAALAAAGPVSAGSGYFLRSQSVGPLGSALAGMSAGGTDASAMAFNPAAIGFLARPSAALGATGIRTAATFAPGSAVSVTGAPISGGDGGDAGTGVVAPAVYLAAPVNRDLAVGLGAASFFGLGSYWSDGWVGRYHALDSELVSLNVNPVVAWRAHPRLVLGAGVQVQYADTELSSAIDFGTIDAVAFGGLAGGAPGADDGRLTVEADDWAAGVTLGALAEPADGLRIGIGYRSALTHRLEGEADFDLGGPVGTTLSAVSGAFVDTGVASRLALPDIVAAGFRYQATPTLAVLGDAMWMRWSRQESLRLDFDNAAQPAEEIRQDWNDSWFFAVGAEYAPRADWTLRAGAAFDGSPVPEATRSPVIADSDSLWLSVGATHRPTDALKLDVALGVILGEDAPIDLEASAPGAAFRGDLAGEVEGVRTLFLGLQAAYEF